MLKDAIDLSPEQPWKKGRVPQGTYQQKAKATQVPWQYCITDFLSYWQYVATYHMELSEATAIGVVNSPAVMQYEQGLMNAFPNDNSSMSP